MLALCFMLLGTYYSQNYAGIIGRSLIISINNTDCLTYPLGSKCSGTYVCINFDGVRFKYSNCDYPCCTSEQVSFKFQHEYG